MHDDAYVMVVFNAESNRNRRWAKAQDGETLAVFPQDTTVDVMVVPGKRGRHERV